MPFKINKVFLKDKSANEKGMQRKVKKYFRGSLWIYLFTKRLVTITNYLIVFIFYFKIGEHQERSTVGVCLAT